jgi:hypothetical protein
MASSRRTLKKTKDSKAASSHDQTEDQKSDISHFPISSITVAVENNLIYGRFAISNDDDYQLFGSVKAHGIAEPLVLSADGILLSGHRRLAAAKYAGLSSVPVRKLDIHFLALPSDEKLKILQRYNTQREKSFEETVRERLVKIDSKKAHADLLRQRIARLMADIPMEKNIAVGKRKKRAVIKTLQFLDAVKKVVFENKPYWPLTDRRVHYLLLNWPPLRHDAKPGSTYKNDKASYKALTDLLVRARLVGEIPMHCIEDPTRIINLSHGYDSAAQFVESETEHFLTGYSRNLMLGQEFHIEVILEKAALRTIVHEVTSKYSIPLTTSRGYCSVPPRDAMARRYLSSGKRRLILFFLSDFDPDGEAIAESFVSSMRDDFGIENLEASKILLTEQDVKENSLPVTLDAKKSSPQYKKFVAKYGTKAVELDAAPVELIQSKLREAIERVIDIELFNAELEREQEDAQLIAAKREAIIQFMSQA